MSNLLVFFPIWNAIAEWLIIYKPETCEPTPCPRSLRSAPRTAAIRGQASQYAAHRTYSTQFTVHSTQHTVHSKQYTVHSTQYTVHSTQYTVHSTQYTVHSTQYTVHSSQYTVHSSQCTVHSTQYTVHSTQYTVHSNSTQYISLSLSLNCTDVYLPQCAVQRGLAVQTLAFGLDVVAATHTVHVRVPVARVEADTQHACNTRRPLVCVCGGMCVRRGETPALFLFPSHQGKEKAQPFSTHLPRRRQSPRCSAVVLTSSSV